VREHGITYSRFIAGLKAAGIDMDRKILAAIAYDEPAAFGVIVEQVKAVMHQAAEDATVAQLNELTEHPGAVPA
jgi:large subunit ribosomal protein L20